MRLRARTGLSRPHRERPYSWTRRLNTMPSPFHGIDLASRALRAFQRQLDVTGHNIGNVNTPGYSRQVVDLVQTEGTTFYGLRPLTLGGGVSIDNVNRIRDQFLEV